MRFPQGLHWNDGLFLQPHHFQYFDWQGAECRRLDRHLALPYPFGLVDFEVDRELLGASTFALRRFSAIMADGQELSMPGNCVLRPLDLSAALKQNPSELTIFVAVPQWSPFEGNLANEELPRGSEKKRWVTGTVNRRDENFGDNEIVMVTRDINARLITNLEDAKDMTVLPVARLRLTLHEGTTAKVALDTAFVPPFIVVGPDSPLDGLCQGLLADVRRCRDKMLGILSATAFRPEHFTGASAHTLLVYKTLNLYEVKLNAILAAGGCTTFNVYLTLQSFLAELMGLYPIHSIRALAPYNHVDAGPAFAETIASIRSFIASEGGEAYIRYPLTRSGTDAPSVLSAEIGADDFRGFDEAYIAVLSEAKELDLIGYLEGGDTFRLTGTASANSRARGIRLTAVRYPPRVLPVLTGALWFKLDVEGAPKLWQEIREGRKVVVDYAADLIPALDASFFVTISDTKKEAANG
jgi:type VI secretion system ImpJ/VasE family protein